MVHINYMTEINAEIYYWQEDNITKSAIIYVYIICPCILFVRVHCLKVAIYAIHAIRDSN